MFVNDGFKIRGWDETGLHVGSARHFGGSSADIYKVALRSFEDTECARARTVEDSIMKTAHGARTAAVNWNPARNSDTRSIVCYKCGPLGHIARNGGNKPQKLWLVGWLSGGFTPCWHLRPSSGREHTIVTYSVR